MAGNGFRQTPAASKKEQARQTAADLANLQMAMRITQMMLQKLAGDLDSLKKDLATHTNMINNLEYRTLATIEVGALDADALNAKADAHKLVDWEKATTLDNEKRGLTPATTVEASSWVEITSEAPENTGIFRSKFKVSDAQIPDLEKTLLGKAVGDKFEYTFNGIVHNVEILAVYSEPVQAPEAQVEQVAVSAVPAPDASVNQ